MKLTKEYVIDDVPDPVKVDMGFDRYQSEVEVIILANSCGGTYSSRRTELRTFASWKASSVPMRLPLWF